MGDSLSECHGCGQLQRQPPLPERGSALCVRCGQVLRRHRPDSLNRTLALTVTGIILFLLANSFPFLSFRMQGLTTQTTLFTGVHDLYLGGEWEIAAVVLFTSILAPGLQLLLLLIVLLALRCHPLPAWLPRLFRWVQTLSPWGMMDVFMLGILVAVVKLSDMASILPGTSLYAFVALIFVLAATQAALDPEIVWERIGPPAGQVPASPAAHTAHLTCEVCELVVDVSGVAPGQDRLYCPRCGAPLHRRKPNSLQRTWALVLAALVLYVPANVLPIMTVISLGNAQSNTIFTGVVFLIEHGMWPLALIVFLASVFIPLLKLLILMFLLVSVQIRSRWRPRDRTRLYRITEAIGRWSMVDVYVVTILVALVHLGNLATIEANAGVVFFCAVVILTMFAAMSFDPRLIWDALERKHDGV